MTTDLPRPTARPRLTWALLAGLYLSRAGAEFVLPSVPLVGAVGGLALGVGGALWLLNRQDARFSFLLLLPYVVYPYQDPRLALACGLLAGTVWIVARWRCHGGWVDAGVFVAALLLYGLTLAPGVQPADGGEFQLVIAEWGVAHPPGYPLYTVLGGILARLLPAASMPLGALAWRVNLFSALTAALALAVVCRAVRRETGFGWAGVIAAGVLGTAATFWTTGTQASIRPLTALFMALMIEAALACRRTMKHTNRQVAKNAKTDQKELGGLGALAVQEKESARALIRFGLAAGFGVTHHASLLFPGGVLALAILAARPTLIRQPRLWGRALLAGLAGALPWAYVWLRGAAGAALAPAGLATWDGFWQHVLASGFAGDLFYYRALPDLLDRLGLIGQVLAFQWHGLVLLLALGALAILAWRDRWLLLALGSAFGAHTLVAATYRAPQTVEYLVPAYVALAVGVGWMVGEIGRWSKVQRLEPPRRQERQENIPRESARIRLIRVIRVQLDSPPARNIAANILPALAAVAIVWSGWPVWISLRAYQWRDPTEANARAVLEAAPPDAVILANWHHVTPLWTLQAAGLRPDVEARYVYPLGAEPILDTWARLITEEAQEGRPLITCSYYPELFRHTGRTFSALESCWQVGELEVPLPDEPPLARFDGFAVRRHADDAPAEFRAGETTALSLAWDWPEALPISEYVTFVHLVDGVGAVLAQDDQPFATSEIAGPGRIVQRYSLSLPRTVLPGTYRLLTGVYRRTPDGLESLRAENGQERVLLAQVDVRPARLPPITGHEWHIPLGRDLILIGYDYDLSLPGRARLYLHWWLGAPTPDEGLSLTLQNETDALAQAALHAAEAGFLTTAHDLPDVATVDGLWLQVQGQDGPLWVRGAWGLPLAPGVWLPGLQPGERYIPVGDVIVTGYAVKGEVEPGSTISATVTLRSATAITQDVSVRLALGAAARTDGTPVGGAIPTLKWGWGAAITDTLRLTLPEDLPPDPGPLTLTFYDAFTGRVWPVSDPALGADGPGLPLTP